MTAAAKKGAVADARIVAAGEAFSAAQMGALEKEAAALEDEDLGARISGESVILDLCEAGDEAAYMERLLRVFGNRTQIGFERMRRPPPAGLKGRILEPLRRLFWMLMRWPHDWAAFQQSAVNEQMIKALTLEVRLRTRETTLLRQRVEALEHGRSVQSPPADAGFSRGAQI